MSSDERVSQECSYDRWRMLLPWYVNRSLDRGERERVRRHLQRCPACRGEVERLAEFAEGLKNAPGPGLSPRESYAKLARILDGRASETRRKPFRAGWRGPTGWIRPLGAAARLALAVLPLLGTVLLGGRLWLTAPRFHTAADARLETGAAEGELRIVFDGAPPLDRIDALLQGAGVRRVAGPDAAGVYVARPLDGREPLAAVLARLREQPGVLFVEPVRP
ncbi:anti-sigma factor family protein [Candidatus Methylocalor cossyra]|uniref:Putative zinc-finger domain-containing protein n=1 Tax=Candidatus Methylocalor cossyra TaxID=3108543 RepID=A0ABM9NJW7_9GAMM